MDVLQFRKGILRTVLAATTALVLGACEGLFPERATPVEGEIDARALSELRQDLDRLDTVDVHVEVDNAWLGERVRAGLERAPATGVEITGSDVRFRDGVGRVSASFVDRRQPDQALRLDGRLEFGFEGRAITWHVRFERADESGVDSDWLDAFNDALHAALEDGELNRVPVMPSPLAEVAASARLLTPIEIDGSARQSMDGVYVLAGLATHVGSDATRFAAQLAFVPRLAGCAPAVTLTRGTFTRRIEEREPVEPVRLPRSTADLQHFYTEIAGAREPLTVVHWWFADGQPVAVEELPVEPSARWRTWSSNTVDDPGARNWSVLVFEQGTGCLLTSVAARLDHASRPGDTDPGSVLADFERATGGLPLAGSGPVRATVAPGFLRRAVGQALRDVHLELAFEVGEVPTRHYEGHLSAFDAHRVRCGTAQCEAQGQCVADLGQCVRQRDTRDCGTCLFRNPLNNRCVNEGEDPVCVAARENRNERFDRERDACLAEQEAARLDCEQRQRQELESCRIEAAAERNACEAARDFLAGYDRREPFAGVSSAIDTGGQLRLVFSEMAMRDDSTQLEARLALRADLALEGTVRFEPEAELGPLQQCISNWNTGFSSRAVTPRRSHRLVVPLAADGTGWVSEWPGFIANGRIEPAPLDAAFAGQPGLLPGCHIQLTAREVARAVSGDVAELFEGELEFRVQPGPVRIEFPGGEMGESGELRLAPP
ncbi:MAG: DUF2914 domain-containing protein [Xanthomonadales bacterium]|nr:DUF2914 domain-containing protein [Xanthomonadales bacterium]